ncbi:MAG: D-Ala-D-Ala carboxypeptidase family metallohydrolase [Pseudomonadota bacterium]
MKNLTVVAASAAALSLLAVSFEPAGAISADTDPSAISLAPKFSPTRHKSSGSDDENTDAATSKRPAKRKATEKAGTEEDKADAKAREKKKRSAKSSDDTSGSKKTTKVGSRTLQKYASFQKAHSRVGTSCFPARLRTVLARVHQRYGTAPVVQSGYRSKAYNRRVGGARKSMHVRCMAADIKVPGVGKYALAKYLKSVSGVGGVGTYACKNFVHVDVGPRRTWHWRCPSKRRS